jgi:hypothetical protein
MRSSYASPASSIDFRTPQVNLTQLSDDAYAALYASVKHRIDRYNEATMLERARAQIDPAAVSWWDTHLRS